MVLSWFTEHGLGYFLTFLVLLWSIFSFFYLKKYTIKNDRKKIIFEKELPIIQKLIRDSNLIERELIDFYEDFIRYDMEQLPNLENMKNQKIKIINSIEEYHLYFVEVEIVLEEKKVMLFRGVIDSMYEIESYITTLYIA